MVVDDRRPSAAVTLADVVLLVSLRGCWWASTLP